MFEIAKLEKINLSALSAGDKDEIERLLSAATAPGIFHLDLSSDPKCSSLLDSLHTMYRLAENYFDQDEIKKTKDVRADQLPSQDRGYKTSFCDETFEMADEELFGGTLQLPELLAPHSEFFKGFSEKCRVACLKMLECISNALEESIGARIQECHRQGQSSDSGLKLIYEPTREKVVDVVDNIHTDSGTFTLLFYDKWGLEVELCGEERWAFTPALEGCALINVANSLQRLSGNRLHSPLHRVTQPFDGFKKRYYISYFLRPERRVKDSW